jgi:hypothetical protein
MSTETKTYNGWTNYETWNVALWIDNEEGSYRYWRRAAQEAYDEAEASEHLTREENAERDLADRLKGEMSEAAPDLGASCWADLLGAALSEVNWDEIAHGMIEETDKEEPEEDDSED